MSEPQNLNAAALERLQRLGGENFVAKMIDLFLEFGGSKIAQTRAAYAAGNLHDLEQAVHPLKSSAGNVGAFRVQELAARLEDLARDGQAELLTAPLEALEQAFAAARGELEKKRR